MRKKTPMEPKTVRNLTALEQDVLVSIHGGTDSEPEPPPEPDNEIRSHLVEIG